MAKPYEIQKQFAALEPDLPLLIKLHKTHQKAYLRTRLDAIRQMWEGKRFQDVLDDLAILVKAF